MGPYLKRKLGWFPVTNIVIANMIGAGIFTTSGLLIADLGNPLIMLCLWLVGGLIALAGAFVYAELGAAFPQAGGEYRFLSELYHPLPGFLSGWISLVAGFSAPIAASAIGFSAYLSRAVPGMTEQINIVFPVSADTLEKGIAILIILVFTLVHAKGIEFGTRVQNGLTLFKIGLLAGLIIMGFTAGSGSLNHFIQSPQITFKLATIKNAGLSLMWIMFAYSGWNAATYIGSEITDPHKNLPRSLISGTAIVVALYLLINAFYIYALSPQEMSGVISIAGLAAGSIFGKAAERTVSALIAFALFSSLSAFIILGPRVYYAMATDGLFFRFFAQVHPKTGVPVAAILLQSAIAILYVMTGSFDQILTYMGFSLGLFPVLTAMGLVKLRKQGAALKMPGYPYTLIFFVSLSLIILLLSLITRPQESGIALLNVAIGVPLYFILKQINKKSVS